jgi:hypothetical protein
LDRVVELKGIRSGACYEEDIMVTGCQAIRQINEMTLHPASERCSCPVYKEDTLRWNHVVLRGRRQKFLTDMAQDTAK